MREQDSKIVTLINQNGIETSIESDAAAKAVSLSSIAKYFVRSSKRQRRLFNPIIDKIDQRSVLRTELEFELTEISKDCYDSYVEYLKNRHSYMLTKADLFAKR